MSEDTEIQLSECRNNRFIPFLRYQFHRCDTCQGNEGAIASRESGHIGAGPTDQKMCSWCHFIIPLFPFLLIPA